MFERFTSQSRRAVVLAQEEASSLNHNYIGTEHLLIGLLHEGSGAAAKALQSMDITLDAARGEVEGLLGRGEEPLSGHIPFTRRAKKSLELSLRESLHLGHHYIGTGHLLLGLISEGGSTAVQVLGRLGADLSSVRERVTLQIRDNSEEEGTSSSAGLKVVVRQQSAVRGLLNTLEERMTAVERHLGVARPAAQAPEAPEAPEAAGRDEVGELRGEVARLRALLREHDIDPDGPGSPSPAAG